MAAARLRAFLQHWLARVAAFLARHAPLPLDMHAGSAHHHHCVSRHLRQPADTARGAACPPLPAPRITVLNGVTQSVTGKHYSDE